jgi:hypothetical protein
MTISARLQSRPAVLFGGVLIFLALVRLPALTGPINLSQDATEYIDAARNFAAGDGLRLGIRAYFFADGLRVPFPATSLRSPLFPLAMGSVYRVFPSPTVFKWFNFVLCLANLTLLVFLLKPLLPTGVAAYSLLLIGMSEPMFLTSIFPWAEQTAFFWLLLALLLTSRKVHSRWGVFGAALEGLVCGAAALSRPEYILVGMLVGAWLSREKVHPGLIASFVAALLLPIALFSIVNLHAYGRTFLPGEYLFQRRDYSSYFAWETDSAQGVAAFLTKNWLWIIGRTARNFVNYTAKLVGWKNLFGLAFVLPLVISKLWKKHYSEGARLLAFVGFAFFSAYCLVWAGMDRERYLLAVTTFLLPLCLLEADRLRRQARDRRIRIACVLILAVQAPLLLANFIYAGVAVHRREQPAERYYARANPSWDNPDLTSLFVWIRSHVGENEVICSENPFLINYQTGRAAVLLPEQLGPGDFSRFLAYYRVNYWISNETYTKRFPGQDQALEPAARAYGMNEAARCGTYVVWKKQAVGSR